MLEDFGEPKKSKTWGFRMFSMPSSPGCGCCSEAFECLEEVQEKLRGQLRGLGFSGEGDPCRWEGIECRDCAVQKIRSYEATGDLSSVVSSLKEMTELTVLNLRGSPVTGNISELSKLERLQVLDLAQTRVVGDVAELSNLRGLQCLYLKQTQVFGDVGELSKLDGLQSLYLTQTQVLGNVANLSKLKGLQRLDLSQTRITGDVADLSTLSQLQRLYLTEVQIVGDVGELSKLNQLEHLYLTQTQVVGNIGVISSMPELVRADLSGTAVSGKLDELRPGCCGKLRRLHLGVVALVVCSSVFVSFCGEVWLYSLISFLSEDTQVRISPGAAARSLSRKTVFLPALESLNANALDVSWIFRV